MSKQRVSIAIAIGLVVTGLVGNSQFLLAQESSQPSAKLSPVTADETSGVIAVQGQTKPDSDREQRLAAYLSQSQFVGKFTIDGMDAPPKTETYTIKKCEKLPSADLYRLTARIKYGDTDQEVPLDLKILWSGSTPVITLDSLWIPTMGTFDARVMIRPGKDAGRYAGTWQHGDKGGHLFGKIVPMKEAAAAESKAETETVETETVDGDK